MDMSRPSCPSTAAVMNTNYVENAGKATSSFFIVSRCFLPSSHVRPFMSPLRFSFRNISYATASALCLLVSLVVSTGAKDYRKCSCVSSFLTSAPPCSLDLLIPVFSAYFVMIMWSILFSLSYSVIFGIFMSVFR